MNADRNNVLFLSDRAWHDVGRGLRLSPRQLELVRHIFEGKKLTAVSRDTGLALGTVKTYSQRIHQKLGVTDQRELILTIIASYLQVTNAKLQPQPSPN